MTYGDCGSFHGYSQASEFNNFARRLIEAGLPLRPDVSYLCANDLVYGLQFILDHGLIKEFTTTRRMDTMTTVYRWR